MYRPSLKHVIKFPADTMIIVMEKDEITITTFPLTEFKQSIVINEGTRELLIEALRCIAPPQCKCAD